jgi:toxin FitB
MYLLDTNVISELRKARPHGAVLAWAQRTGNAQMHLSAVTIAELQIGVELTRKQDEAKAAEIERWLDKVAATFNVISMDAAAFRLWAKLMSGKSTALSEDGMIAATAQIHNLTVVTRNVKDFTKFGVAIFNPFA